MKKLMMVMMVIGMAAAAWAEASFSYSGQLRDEKGGALAELDQKITFSLYSSQAGGSALWARLIQVQLDTNGFFAVELSDAVGTKAEPDTSLESVLTENATLYIGLNVLGSGGEISPRQKLLSAPRAAFAEDVKVAKQNFSVTGYAMVGGNLTVGETLTAKKVTATESLSAPSLSAATSISAPTLTAATSISAPSLSVTDSITASTLKATTLDATTVKQDGKVLVPKGAIIMWSGTTAPAGWALCDGNNGTPDLRGRFIVGYDPSDGDYNDVKVSGGKTGGAKTVTLTTNEMPAHSHSLKNDFTEAVGLNMFSQNQGRGTCNVVKSGTDIHLWFNGYSITSTGGSQAHENRPPYYALAYIMKL